MGSLLQTKLPAASWGQTKQGKAAPEPGKAACSLALGFCCPGCVPARIRATRPCKAELAAHRGNPSPPQAHHGTACQRTASANPSVPSRADSQGFGWRVQSLSKGLPVQPTTSPRTSQGCFGRGTSYSHILRCAYRVEGGPTSCQAKRSKPWVFRSPPAPHLLPGTALLPVPQTPQQQQGERTEGNLPADHSSQAGLPQRGQRGKRRNSSISAGMSSCKLLQQISLACTVLRRHPRQRLGCVTLRHVETREECKP